MCSLRCGPLTYDGDQNASVCCLNSSSCRYLHPKSFLMYLRAAPSLANLPFLGTNGMQRVRFAPSLAKNHVGYSCTCLQVLARLEWQCKSLQITSALKN